MRGVAGAAMRALVFDGEKSKQVKPPGIPRL
jgi:hypothetical protein